MTVLVVPAIYLDGTITTFPEPESVFFIGASFAVAEVVAGVTVDLVSDLLLSLAWLLAVGAVISFLSFAASVECTVADSFDVLVVVFILILQLCNKHHKSN